jgi:nicotinamidase/pyrazinamidase
MVATQVKFKSDTAFLVIDVQNDFLAGGALAVADGNAVVPVINGLAQQFEHVILTQDWHPKNHRSFASQHADVPPFGEFLADYGRQTVWPDHCVQGSFGAELAVDLAVPHARLIVRKGLNPAVDSYSAFVEADGKTRTGLAAYLRDLGIQKVVLAGLATDFCVCWTALDAVKAGFECVVIQDACRAIDVGGSLADALSRMKTAGVAVMTAEQALALR